jgi:uncharacterized protein (DUF305 family)
VKISTNFLVIFLACGLAMSAMIQAGDRGRSGQAGTGPDWSELIASMDKMHTAMGTIERTGNSDVDFVKLMLPHHQAALDMAKTQLLYGKDPQMRRLAQEIINNQQFEIDLMERWLKEREPAQTESQVEINPATAAETRKGNPP